MDRRIRLAFAGLCLVGGVLAVCFLLFAGLMSLTAVATVNFMVQLFAGDGAGNSEDGLLAFAPTATVMAVLGLALGIGLLDLSFRLFAQKPMPRKSTVLVFLVATVLVTGIALSIARRAMPPSPTLAVMKQLDGIWVQQGSPRQTFRFRPDGVLLCTSEGFGSGPFGTWSISGQKITIVSDRDWTVVGTLTLGAIRGASSETKTGYVYGPVTWIQNP